MQNVEIDKLRFQGYGYKKIAALLGLAENSVKSYCRRNPLDKSQKICIQCGKTIKDTPQKRAKKFCSDKCRLEWWNSHPELVNRKTMYDYTCEFCGKKFQSYNTHRKYCSRSCYADARRREAEYDG